ncbi:MULTISPECIES: hypothetical protein [unclassified Blastomonas]|uniref:hypothetical protein n=1 Tax=unclassified Blastomonas TaxID=2626550 RepID=UPI0008246D2A|nr:MULTISPECIES: hypothetical protein [unclassified Blastomonas]
MSGGDDWQPGDLALCVSSEGFHDDFVEGNQYPAIGSVSRVNDVCLLEASLDDKWNQPGGVWLSFDEYPVFLCFSGNFRKIRPHVPDEEDAETIRLLTGTPVKEPTA